MTEKHASLKLWKSAPLAEINHPHPKNPRVIPDADSEEVRTLDASLEHDYFDPLIWNKRNRMWVSGHVRAWRMTALGFTHADVVVVDYDEETHLARMLAANAHSGKNDEDKLDALLASLREASVDPVLALLSALPPAPPPPAGDADVEPDLDRAAELNKIWLVEPGEVWQIGPHRLMCGSSRGDDVDHLIDRQINVAFTSPPYASQRKYDEASGFKPVPPDEYVEWFAPVSASVKKHIAEDGSFFVNIKPCADGLDTHLYVFDLVIAHVRAWGWHFATEFCWERTGVPKSVTRRFKNQFEPVYQFAIGDWKMRPERVKHASNDVPMSLGKGSGNTAWSGRQGNGGVIASNRRPRREGKSSTKSLSEMQGTGSDVGDIVVNGMAFPGNRLPNFNGTHEATGHTAAFPVGLPSFFIAAYSDQNDAIYDPFLGSGTTMVAAQNLHRICYGMEISPDYCAVILDRMHRAFPDLEIKRVA
jgi:DNA modification methylase